MKKLWREHGTKLIGAATTVVGAVATIDPATLAAILTAIAGPKGAGLAVMIGGGLTIWRGFKNTKIQKGEVSETPQVP